MNYPWCSCTVRLLLALGFHLGAAIAMFGADTRRPNIIFLLADDLRWDAMGFAGNKMVRTPNLDRLSSQGVVFRNHFVTTSICNVSRASIFSGQYARRHGITDFATPFTRAQWSKTYPALLRDAGYRIGFIGKFGVGNDKAIAVMTNQFDYWRGLPGQAGLFFDKNDPTRTHKTARFGEQALEFLGDCSTNQPFCLSVSFNAPHARDGQPREFWPDERDENLFAELHFPRPAKWTDEWFARLPEFVQQSEGRRRWQKRFVLEELFQRTAKDYHRLVSGVDREVGRIIETVRQRGVAENTVFIFTSDNGFFLGERGMADKWLPYEESVRVPLMIFDPRAQQQGGVSCNAMTLNIDFAPTLLEFAGIRTPATMQGRSLLPLIERKQPRGWRTDFLYEHYTRSDIIPPSEGVRSDRWKYIRWMEREPVVEELYDLRADPGEERNLAGESKHRRDLADMRVRWEELRRKLK